jgi:hypothetical protein
VRWAAAATKGGRRTRRDGCHDGWPNRLTTRGDARWLGGDPSDQPKLTEKCVLTRGGQRGEALCKPAADLSLHGAKCRLGSQSVCLDQRPRREILGCAHCIDRARIQEVAHADHGTCER